MMMKKILENAYRIFLVLLIMGVGAVYVESAKADYTLVMVTYEERIEFGFEPFIAYSDCRTRGLKNLDLLDSYREFNVGMADTRVGFYCQAMEVEDNG